MSKRRSKKERKMAERVENEQKVCPVCGRPLDDDTIEGCAVCNGGDEIVDYSVDEFCDVP
ncbi:MAG: hypothetical protein GXP63_02385 [DPANN group archaeon]|nr:hypothetical protein [DPANN group archaeon]